MSDLAGKSGIYCITNTINGKKYIGRSVNLAKRISEHKYYLKIGKHHNVHLQAAYNMYGADKFVGTILELCPIDKLSEREIYWIAINDSQNNGYNMSAGGEGGNGVEGEEHWWYDDTEYNFYNDEEGIEYSRTRQYMYTHYDVSKQGISDLITGKAHQHRGWRMTKDKIWQKKFNYYHIDGMEELNVTAEYMVKEYELEYKQIYAVGSGGKKIYEGWTNRKGLKANTKGVNLYSLYNKEGDALEDMTIQELSAAIPASVSYVSQVVGGSKKAVKGWTTKEKLHLLKQ